MSNAKDSHVNAEAEEQASHSQSPEILSGAPQELTEDQPGAVGDVIYKQVKIYDASHPMCEPISPASGFYEAAQVYERVPDVNIAQLLSAAGGHHSIYEQAPDVNIAMILSQVLSSQRTSELVRCSGTLPHEESSAYESVRYSESVEQLFEALYSYERVAYNEAAMQLLRGLPHVAQISAFDENRVYERVYYSEMMERMFGDAETYERIQYSEFAMQILRRMPNVAHVCTDNESCMYERVQYSESLEQLFQRSPIDIYQRIEYSELAIQMLRSMPHVAYICTCDTMQDCHLSM